MDMKKSKFHLYAGPAIMAVLEALGGKDFSRTSRMNIVCERYLAMVEDELSDLPFTQREWCAIFDANHGVQLDAGMVPNISLIWTNVHDTKGLGAKWKIDQIRLVRALQELPKTALIAIQEACDRFWSHTELGTDEALGQAGVRVPS
jgi:hypothetical protein